VGGSSSGRNAKCLIEMEFRGTKLRLSCAVSPPDFRRDPNRRAPSIFHGLPWPCNIVTLRSRGPPGPKSKTNQIHPQTKTITNQNSTTITNQDHLETKNQPKPTDVNAAAGNGVWPPRGLRRSFQRRPRAAQFPADHPRIPLTTQNSLHVPCCRRNMNRRCRSCYPQRTPTLDYRRIAIRGPVRSAPDERQSGGTSPS
jgi:hypothetical protein